MLRPCPLVLALLAALPLTSAGCRSSSPSKPPLDGPATVDGGVATIPTATAMVRISSPVPGAMRVQLSPAGEWPPAIESFAVDPAALASPGALDVQEAGGVVTVRAALAGVRLTRTPFRIALLDGAGEVIAEQASAPTFSGPPAITWPLGAGAHVFGVGDKVKGYDRRGQTFNLWNTDSYGWDAGLGDPLYKSIPFFLLLEDGQAHAIFVDNPSRAFVDVGAADPGRLLYQAAHAPAWDLYLFAGPDPKDVLTAYTAITGRTPLPPRWTLGYHQSRYSYMTEVEVRDVASRLRADQIPADAIWLDIDYQQNNAPFTVNAGTFPTFAAMVDDLLAMDLRTVVITDPHIKKLDGYAPYDSGTAADVFVRTTSGEPYVGSVWPGPSVFPDFTLSRVRTWWGGLYATFVGQHVAGFWNDMNEPAIFGGAMPDDTPHRLDDGTSVDHLTVHNAYGLLNARATFEGVRSLRPAARPFVLTRAAYAGAQRWAASWTGDNVANRQHLAVTIPQLANLGASGYAFVGADVGGFVGCPDADLLAEWMELAAFQPFFRNHSEKGSCRREPWARGDALEARMRSAIERRYRLLPYLYTAFEETARTGVPVMRALWLEYPADPAALVNDRAFLLGRDLLVAPKLAAGTAPWQVALPSADWWDTSTGLLVSSGGTVTVTPAADESVRVFARAGAIVPGQPVTPSAASVPTGALRLDVWPGGDCTGALYLDAGDGYGHEAGELRRIAYACQPGASGIAVSSATAAGAFPTWWSSTEVVVHGVPASPTAVESGGVEPPWVHDATSSALTVSLPGGADWTLTASW